MEQVEKWVHENRVKIEGHEELCKNREKEHDDSDSIIFRRIASLDKKFHGLDKRVFLIMATAGTAGGLAGSGLWSALMKLFTG